MCTSVYLWLCACLFACLSASACLRVFTYSLVLSWSESKCMIAYIALQRVNKSHAHVTKLTYQCKFHPFTLARLGRGPYYPGLITSTPPGHEQLPSVPGWFASHWPGHISSTANRASETIMRSVHKTNDGLFNGSYRWKTQGSGVYVWSLGGVALVGRYMCGVIW